MNANTNPLDTSVPDLKVTRDVASLRAQVAAWRKASLSVALVPTMGALHAGHYALIKTATSDADKVVVSVFVNPTQFGPGEDYQQYPRDEAADLAGIAASGGHLCFAPEAGEMYGPGHATTVSVTGLSDILCGALRPGHFDGVATVVAKLLLQCLPDVAIFGEKDFQQLLVIRRLVADLDIPVRILSGAIVREADGLALSSRNAYLSDDDRQNALALTQTLEDIAQRARAGEDMRDLEIRGRDAILKGGFQSVDYVEFRFAEDLTLATNLDTPVRVLAAARIGGTRLIDNRSVQI